MVNLSETDRALLINAIAGREGTARKLAKRFGTTVEDLKSFVEENREAIELAKEALGESEQDSDEPTPTQLSELWIASKFDRLLKLQRVADLLYDQIADGVNDPTVLREFRSYTYAAANELGQLLHRGSGDSGSGDTVSYEISNVDMEALR